MTVQLTSQQLPSWWRGCPLRLRLKAEGSWGELRAERTERRRKKEDCRRKEEERRRTREVRRNFRCLHSSSLVGLFYFLFHVHPYFVFPGVEVQVSFRIIELSNNPHSAVNSLQHLISKKKKSKNQLSLIWKRFLDVELPDPNCQDMSKKALLKTCNTVHSVRPEAIHQVNSWLYSITMQIGISILINTQRYKGYHFLASRKTSYTRI